MKCPECGYNSFDYLEYCKKCGAPLYLEAEPVSSIRDESSDIPSNGERDDVSPEDLFDISIHEREHTERAGRPVSSPDSESEPDYNERSEAESESFDDLPPSELKRENIRDNKKHEPAGRRAGRRAAGKQMGLFEESEASGYSGGRASIPNEQGRRYRGRIRENEYESYDKEMMEFSLAGFFSRAAAFVIDILIISLTAFLAIMTGLYILRGSSGDNDALKNIIIPVYLALLLLASTYFIFLHGIGGKTVGKMILGIRLINGEGESPGLWDAFVRWIGYFVSAGFLFIGFLWALFDSEGQTWHDKIAGTYVVRD